MTAAPQILEFPILTRTAPRGGDLGPRWSLLAIWALFAVVGAGGLGASLALPKPGTGAAIASDEALVAQVERRVPAADVLAARVQRLRKSLATDASDGAGWLLLARTQGDLGQYAEAVAAYRHAAIHLTPDATLLADWADAQVSANQGEWDSTARQLVERALALEEQHLKALSLAGAEAFARHRPGLAIAYWERIRLVAPAASMAARQARANIAEAQRRQLSGR